jgi:hypothetical protein
MIVGVEGQPTKAPNCSALVKNTVLILEKS